MKNHELAMLVLYISLILMKAFGWISLSWIWVLCPIWITLLIIAVMVIVMFLTIGAIIFILLIKAMYK